MLERRRAVALARHFREIPGEAARRDEFATEQIHVGRIRGGKLIERWSVWDDLGQALQLGLIGG